MVEKTCRVCGISREEDLFKKNENICKKCASERSKKYRKDHPNKVRESKRKYYIKHAKEISENNKKWREQNPKEAKEKSKENSKKWREQNPEKSKENCKKYRINNQEKERKRGQKYYKSNLEKVTKQHKIYNKTPNGKKARHKIEAKRRNLGHEPINMWFKGSEAHHLRYSRNIKEQDNDITLYVPRKLHRSIHHNGNTGKGMKEINIVCLQWYFENTPKEEQNPKATKLYNNYLTLPEPQWGGDEQY